MGGRGGMLLRASFKGLRLSSESIEAEMTAHACSGAPRRGHEGCRCCWRKDFSPPPPSYNRSL